MGQVQSYSQMSQLPFLTSALALHLSQDTPLQCECPQKFSIVSAHRDLAVATPMKIRLERRFCLNSRTGLQRLQFVGLHSLWPSVFVNKVLLECYFPHLLKYCIWLLLHNNNRAEWLWQRPYDLQRPKNIFSLASYRKSMMTPDPGSQYDRGDKTFSKSCFLFTSTWFFWDRIQFKSSTTLATWPGS